MSFGTQTMGTQTYNSENLSLLITAVSPGFISRVGGDLVTLYGTFPTNELYTISIDGEIAYSGVSGQGTVCRSIDGTSLTFVMPMFKTIGVKTIGLTASPSNNTDSIGITVLERNFNSTVYRVRRRFPPNAETGSRLMELEPVE